VLAIVIFLFIYDSDANLRNDSWVQLRVRRTCYATTTCGSRLSPPTKKRMKIRVWASWKRRRRSIT